MPQECWGKHGLTYWLQYVAGYQRRRVYRQGRLICVQVDSAEPSDFKIHTQSIPSKNFLESASLNTAVIRISCWIWSASGKTNSTE